MGYQAFTWAGTALYLGKRTTSLGFVTVLMDTDRIRRFGFMAFRMDIGLAHLQNLETPGQILVEFVTLHNSRVVIQI